MVTPHPNDKEAWRRVAEDVRRQTEAHNLKVVAAGWRAELQLAAKENRAFGIRLANGKVAEFILPKRS